MADTMTERYEHILALIHDFERENGVSVSCTVSQQPGSAFSYNQAIPMKSASLSKLFIAKAVIDICERKDIPVNAKIPLPAAEEPLSGILSSLCAKELPIADILYFLLAHSDNSAHNVLLDFLSQNAPDASLFHEYPDTVVRKVGKGSVSITTASDAYQCLESIVRKPQYQMLRGFLSGGSGTKVSLNYLPTRLQSPTPEIQEFYSKVGFLPDSVHEAIHIQAGDVACTIVVLTHGWVQDHDWYTDLNQGRQKTGILIQGLYRIMNSGIR